MNKSKKNDVNLLNKVKLWEVDKTFYNWYNNQLITSKIAFISCIIIGFITHIYVYTHRFMNEDDVGRIKKAYAEIGSGRWFNNIFNYFNYHYTPPMMIGLYLILFTGISASFLCKVFNINKKINAFLIGGLLVTFPVIAITNGYLYESAGYFFAAMLSALAFYFTVKYKFGFLIGSICFMLTLATYQAKVNIALSLCLFYLIVQLLSEQYSFKDLRNNILKFMLLVVLGGIFYMVSIYITIGKMSTYYGMDQSLKIHITEIPAMLKKTYLEFYDGFFGNNFMTSIQVKCIFIIILIITIIFIIITIIRHKIYKQALRLAFILFFLLLIPIANNFSGFILTTNGIYPMMMYSFVFIFIFCIIISEKCRGTAYVLRSIFTASLVVVMLNQMIVSNIHYLKLDMFYQRTYSLTTRILARIDPLIPQSSSKKIALIGFFPSENYPESTTMFKEKSNDRALNQQYIGYINTSTINRTSTKFVSNVNAIHGISLQAVSIEELNKLRNKMSDIYMPSWPSEGSVDIIDDIIVVKLSEDKRFEEVMDTNAILVSLEGVTFDNNNAKYHLDAVDVSGDILTIRGWAFIEDTPSKETIINVYLYNEDNKDLYKISTAKKERGDVANHFDNDNYAYSGYVGKTDASKLDIDKNNYKILLKYKMGEKETFVDTGKYLHE